MYCVWKINRKLVEIMEALDGILYAFIPTVGVLSRHFLPLPNTGSCPCLCRSRAFPCGAGIRDAGPQIAAPLPPFPSQEVRGAGSLPSPPCSTDPAPGQDLLRAGARPGSASRCQNCGKVALNKSIACPAALLCSFPQQKGSNYKKTLQKAWEKGQGTFTGGKQNIRKSVGSIRQFIKLLPGAWRRTLFTAARAEG